MTIKPYITKFQESVKAWWLQKALCDFNGAEYTYGDVAQRIERLHILFEQGGIRKGDHIALCAKNSAAWGISFLSITTYRAVVVPILVDFTPDAVSHLTDHSDSVILFTDAEIWEKLDKAAMPHLKAAINVADGSLLYSSDERISAAAENLDVEFKSRHPLGFTREDVNYPDGDEKDLALINYTSGTTSSPKGVMIRYESLSDQVEFDQVHLPATPADKLVSMLPMAHMYGLMIEFLYPICSGVTIYFLGRTPSPSLLMGAMQKVRPYLIASVPLVMEKIYKKNLQGPVHKLRGLLWIPVVGSMLYRKMGRKLLDAFGGRVRMIVLGGAPMNREAEKVFHRGGLPYIVGFGMTEGAPLITYSGIDEYIPGTCGKPIHEMRIDSEDPQHIAGEILTRGVNVCSGYYKNPQATANAFTEDGFLRTGDLGIFDAHGNLIIKGRSKTMILSANGQNIYPEEIESVLNAEKYIAESLVVDRSGRLVALIYLDKEKIRKDSLDAEAVADIPHSTMVAVNKLLPSYSQLAKVEVVVEPFAKTPKMSIKRFMYK
ncbi:MAG: AMP-binding protein [Bacteroidales bacterium]|nr:AMP-binding protein [Bacteroidales bacterium]